MEFAPNLRTLMMSHLLANWVQVWRAPGGYQLVHVARKPYNLYLD